MTALAKGRPWLLAAATAIVHALTAWRYGYFRDELYFIACAKHLAWGYVDQPPLVALAAWLAAPAGYQLLALRAFPVLAAAGTVAVAVLIARELGGKAFAQVLTGVTVGLMPANLALGNILTTSSFDGVSWTLLAYVAIRLVKRAPQQRTVPWRLWAGIAVVIAFGLYGKYAMALCALALLGGLLLTPQRRVLATAALPACVLLTTLLVLPNVVWQWSHGWPFFEVIAGDAAHRHAFTNGIALESQDFAANTIAYLGEQLLYTNPAAAPVWIAGLIGPLAWPRLRDVRFVSIAYALLVAAAVALEAKGYYTTGIYATLFAIGSCVVERAPAWLRAATFAVASAVALATLPISLPVLPIDGFIAYSRAIGLASASVSAPPVMQPLYAEEFGWEGLARDVAAVYQSMPHRARIAVYADTYADAGAIDFYGAKFGLPPAIGSQNTYWLWGPRDYDGRKMIAVGASRIDLLKKYYRSCDLIRTSVEPLKAVVEGPAPIYRCSGPRMPFSSIWPKLRWYGA